MKSTPLILLVLALTACGGGGDSPSPNSPSSSTPTAPPKSDLGDVCYDNEDYFPYSDGITEDSEIILRIPRAGDSISFAGILEVATAEETISEQEDDTVTYYEVSDQSSLVLNNIPPFSNGGYWFEWNSETLVTAKSTSNIDGTSLSSTYLYASEFGRYLIKSTDGSHRIHEATIDSGTYEFWGSLNIPPLTAYSSYSEFYKVLSSDARTVTEDGVQDITVNSKVIINTGLGCVEAMEVTVARSQVARSVGGIDEFFLDLTNANNPEKITGSEKKYVHPALGIIRNSQQIEVFQDDSDASPIAIATRETVLIDSNIDYLLPEKILR